MNKIEVKAPVTGTVWKVLARVGDTVEEGADLMILESMKMEIPVPAPIAGEMVAVAATEGAAVEEGQVVAAMQSV